MQFDDVLTNQPVVIDNGSGMIKAGFAGDDFPKTYFSSCILFYLQKLHLIQRNTAIKQLKSFSKHLTYLHCF
ncbi:hypothetical protein HMI55_005249 [Coelomomyces lativittatus]|nr:hypothetical protein HMI55_005249 [Coelomomyces lativittatus]